MAGGLISKVGTKEKILLVIGLILIFAGFFVGPTQLYGIISYVIGAIIIITIWIRSKKQQKLNQ